MATKSKSKTAAPRYPERKWGPFHGGLGVAVWLNEVETPEGKRFFRSVTIAPRRFRKDGRWQDAGSLRPVDLPSLLLALQAAHEFIHSTPLPGEAAELDEPDGPGSLDSEPGSDEVPY
jgi:hypothetical protein